MLALDERREVGADAEHLAAHETRHRLAQPVRALHLVEVDRTLGSEEELSAVRKPEGRRDPFVEGAVEGLVPDNRIDCHPDGVGGLRGLELLEGRLRDEEERKTVVTHLACVG